MTHTASPRHHDSVKTRAAARLLLAVSALALTVLPALGQEGGRQGIAYVQAPEMSSGVGFGPDAASAFAAAKQQCIEGGGTAEDCLEMSYCFPARFSVDVFLQQSDGPHWHEFYCGWDSKELALEAARVACDLQKRPYLIECAPVMLFDEDGKSEEVPFGD